MMTLHLLVGAFAGLAHYFKDGRQEFCLQVVREFYERSNAATGMNTTTGVPDGPRLSRPADLARERRPTIGRRQRKRFN
jgi:hypothetical protein